MKRIFIFIVFIFLALNLNAQEEDKLLVSEIKQSTVITQPATLSKGFFLVGSIFTFNAEDKMFSVKGKRDFAPRNLWATFSTEYLHVHYGFTSRIEVAVALPYKIISLNGSVASEVPLLDTTITTKIKQKANGIGDVELGIYYQVIKGSRTKPSLVGKLSATLPTGEKNLTDIKGPLEYNLPTGSGEATLSLELVYRKITYPYSYSFYGLFKYSFGGEKVLFPYEDPVSFRSGNYYFAGGNFNFLLNDWIAVQNDLQFVYQRATKSFDTTSYPKMNSLLFSYHPNISFQFKKFRLVQGFIIPLWGKSTPADPQYNIDFQYIF